MHESQHSELIVHRGLFLEWNICDVIRFVYRNIQDDIHSRHNCMFQTHYYLPTTHLVSLICLGDPGQTTVIFSAILLRDNEFKLGKFWTCIVLNHWTNSYDCYSETTLTPLTNLLQNSVQIPLVMIWYSSNRNNTGMSSKWANLSKSLVSFPNLITIIRSGIAFLFSQTVYQITP